MQPPAFLLSRVPCRKKCDRPAAETARQHNGAYLFSIRPTGCPGVPHTHAELIADGERPAQPGTFTRRFVPNILPEALLVGLPAGRYAGRRRWCNDALLERSPAAGTFRKKLLDTMVRERVTVMGAVPAMYEIVAGQPGSFDLRLRMVFRAASH